MPYRTPKWNWVMTPGPIQIGVDQFLTQPAWKGKKCIVTMAEVGLSNPNARGMVVIFVEGVPQWASFFTGEWMRYFEFGELRSDRNESVQLAAKVLIGDGEMSMNLAGVFA